ncbi:hypothetical protein BDV19DRAFT_365336 [Aspergillus venezuelensis]
MHRRSVVQLSRHNAVQWPGTARLRDAAVACSSRRCFHPSLTTSLNGPRWGARIQPQQQSSTPALSPEEQALRNALLSKSTEKKQQLLQQEKQPRPPRQPPQYVPQESQSRSRIVPDSSQSQAPQFTPKLSHPVPRKQWGQWGSQQTLNPIQRDPELNRIKSGQRRQTNVPYPLDDKESRNGQPLAKYEINGPKTLPGALRHQDWTCPDCGQLCFGKHTLCPLCKARRPIPKDFHPSKSNLQRRGNNYFNPPERNDTWKCPGCGFPCFNTRWYCPKCNTKKPKGDHDHLPAEPRTNTVRDLRLDPSADAYGNSVADDLKIRKIVPQSRKTDDRQPTPRQTAIWKHAAAKSAAQEAQEFDEEGAYGYQRRAKVAKPKSTDFESDSYAERARERDGSGTRDKKSGRRGARGRESEEVGEEEFDIDEYYKQREERKKQKKQRAREKEVAEPEAKPLYLPEFISVSNLADVFGMRPAQLVQQMEEMGFEDVSYSHVLDAETAGLVATEFGYDPMVDSGAENDLTAAPIPEDKSIWPSRPPVVTIMGHVDHGKTTILDWLRKASVAASEHGGITQHIGAFSVGMPSGKRITFLDTPGHAAFLDMRRRGADVTDIVVLVVAADDSVKPQTIEAIKHATSAKVPVIVAISKIDKEGIDPEKVKQDLSVNGIYVEDYGGDVQAIGVSGKTGQGMLELEEAIITLSEVLDHRADTNGYVEGWVIEGTTKSYGRVATVLVRRGTLRPGDILVAGKTWTRVRTLRNEAGVSISEATPGMPVEIDGWRDQPAAGSEMLQAGDEQHAKDVVDYRLEKEEIEKLSEDTTAINEARRELVAKRAKEAAEGEDYEEEEVTSGPKSVNFIIKADVDGSAEAVLNSVTAVGNNEVYARVLRSEVGPISESDIELAAAANGHIITFNTPIDLAMSRMAESLAVSIKEHNIIYKLVDDVKDTLSEQLAPTITQRVTGEAEIGQIFEISLKRQAKTFIAGCKVRNGLINRTKKVRVLRGQETIYDGSITSLKNVKKDVTEMRKDTECGIGFEGWTDFAVGDQVQCYEEVSEKRHL